MKDDKYAIICFCGWGDDMDSRVIHLKLIKNGEPASVFQAIYRAFQLTRVWPEFSAVDFAAAFIQSERVQTRRLPEQTLWLGGEVTPDLLPGVLRRGLHHYWYWVYQRDGEDIVVESRQQFTGGYPLDDPCRKYILANRRFPQGKPPSAALLKPESPTRSRTVRLS